MDDIKAFRPLAAPQHVRFDVEPNEHTLLCTDGDAIYEEGKAVGVLQLPTEFVYREAKRLLKENTELNLIFHSYNQKGISIAKVSRFGNTFDIQQYISSAFLPLSTSDKELYEFLASIKFYGGKRHDE